MIGPWVTCDRCGTHSCSGHSQEQCDKSLEFQRICATGDQAAIDEFMRQEQAAIDATMPRLYCELCRKTFIALSHRHTKGGVLVYEVKGEATA